MRHLVLFLFLIVAVDFCSAQGGASSVRKNELYIADSLYNFGIAINKKIIAHTYYLINNTNDTLQIDTVNASCDCLKIQYPKSLILPKSRSNIVTQLPTKDKDGEIEYYFQVRFKGDYAPAHGIIKGTIKE
ncbi:MAG: DUF1573 domain-containing protein [Bacteroidetes bacterium]|nr:DUF1573 domain-containing protein [Bacteroidota bacterium]